MPSAGPDGTLAATLAGLWARRQETFAQRASVIESAVASLLAGSLDEPARAEAESAAHKLTGTLGTFGVPAGSDLARELERAFASRRLDLDEAPRLSKLVLALQDAIEQGPQVPTRPEPVAGREESSSGRDALVLVASDDAELVERLSAEALALGFRTVNVRRAEAAERVRSGSPVAVVVDLGGDGAQSCELAQISRAAAGAPVVVLALESSFEDRVRSARQGAAVFLARATPVAEVVTIASDVLDQARLSGSSVVVVDDDPAVIDALAAMLGPCGIEVSGVTHPERLWGMLAEASPDLLVLDLAMGEVSGIDLCRVIRSEPRFRELPILFLTANKAPDVIERIFAAGADDYLPKPIAATELTGRIQNRIKRARLMKQLADRDPLTRIPNRRKASREMVRTLDSARRHGRPVSLALLDLDLFKTINDRHGHATGDAVLRTLGTLLARSVRGEDVIGRWGGEEFVVCLSGADREQAVARVEAMLNTFRAVNFPCPQGALLGAAFSAGVAAYPADADGLEGLVWAADAALYAAKRAGRGRVMAAGADILELLDVVIVEDDDALGDLLTHALQTRGYRTARISDGVEATTALGGASPRLRARVALLDVDLPGRDGLSVLRGLARDGALEQLRVIVLTARAAETEVLKALELGAVDHVAKPFSIPVLMQRVERTLAGA